MALRRIQISLHRGRAMEATRVVVRKKKLVYVLVADKKISYKKGKSRIAYIGTTEKGGARIAQSIAYRAEDIFAIRGIHEFHARVITCKSRRNVETWKQLERALILSFKRKFGEAPVCNTQGKNMKRSQEYKYFSDYGCDIIIEELS